MIHYIIGGLVILSSVVGFFFFIRFGSYSGVIGDDNPFLQKDLVKRKAEFSEDNDELDTDTKEDKETNEK